MTSTIESAPRTFVLVHGAWHDGQAWQRVVPLLRAHGHRVLAPTLTGHGDTTHLLGPDIDLSTHVEDITATVLDNDLTDVVLVGHSYAGMIISAAAHRIPDRIAHLVFVDAMALIHGESALDVMPITQMMIDDAAATDQPWRIPPLPEMPAPHGLFGVTARGPRLGPPHPRRGVRALLPRTGHPLQPRRRRHPPHPRPLRRHRTRRHRPSARPLPPARRTARPHP
ncbi:alpha/beta fold hydrolase [Pseudonocardia ailaonensis]|uniref:alpha/beta fold hydrolase n=1 Tax=Pseudonocardia ailaonensis TaxID=367279 RepID=UPI0031CFC6F1